MHLRLPSSVFFGIYLQNQSAVFTRRIFCRVPRRAFLIFFDLISIDYTVSRKSALFRHFERSEKSHRYRQFPPSSVILSR
ncbi:MAG: hypothetical protein IJ566_02335 [Cardiobacteriaceae bacterium]|nr:hypothetical protein [Cardiobacteriaceae bacterium]